MNLSRWDIKKVKQSVLMTSVSSDDGQKPELSLSPQEALSMDIVMAKTEYLKSNDHTDWTVP